MAIVKNFWLVNQKKKLGGAVIYQAMGQTRSRELAASVSNPRTQSQMLQRCKWANLVNLYRVNRDWMKYAFETKKENQSEYNKFMSLNVSNSQIYLTKQAAAAGSCVVNDYLITQGTLPSVEFNFTGRYWFSNIYFDRDGVLANQPSIAQVTASLLAANPVLREGDQISFIRLTQMTNSTTGLPYVVVRRYEVLLNSADNRNFYDFMPEDYIVQQSYGNNSCLSVEDSGNAGGFAIIVSRTIGGKTFVSTQRIIVANNAETIGQWTGSSALQAAINSYGQEDDAFLSTTTANVALEAATQLSVTAVKLDGVVYTAGERYADMPVLMDKAAEISFNRDISEAIVKVKATVVDGGTYISTSWEDATPSGTKATISQLSNDWDFSGATLYQVQVAVDDQVFTMQYRLTNADWIEGLE